MEPQRPALEKECKNWYGSKDQNGYGRFYIDGKSHRAHRVSYRLNVGKIPIGYKVCHKCDNPSCVEPSHLFVGTDSDNMRDMVVKGRHPGSRKTECKRGHKFVEQNTARRNGGKWRECLECRRMLNAQYRERKLALGFVRDPAGNFYMPDRAACPAAPRKEGSDEAREV